MLDHPKRISFFTLTLAIALAAVLGVPHAAAAVDDSGEIRVNVGTSTYHRPALAVFSDGSFVVVWTPAEANGLRARFFDHRGQPRGGEVSLAVGDTSAWWVDQAIADHQGGFLLAWTGNKAGGRTTGIFVRRFRRDGTPRGRLIRASAPHQLQRDSAVLAVARNGTFAVAWRSMARSADGHEYSNAVGRVFHAGGKPLTPELLLGEGFGGYPGDANEHAHPAALALAPDRTLTAVVTVREVCSYSRVVRLAPGDTAAVPVSGYACQGYLDWDSRGSLALTGDGGGLATWGGSSLFGYRFAPDGTQLGDTIWLNATSTELEVDPMAALQADGSFVASWEGLDRDGAGVFARAFDAEGRPLADDFRVNETTAGEQRYPVIGSAGRGPVVVVWTQHTADDARDVLARVLPIGAIR